MRSCNYSADYNLSPKQVPVPTNLHWSDMRNKYFLDLDGFYPLLDRFQFEFVLFFYKNVKIFENLKNKMLWKDMYSNSIQ